MRRALLGLMIGTACGQTISMTSPTASQTLAGYQFTLASNCVSCPTLYSVEYDVDDEVAGISRTGDYVYYWNP
jgi:hypothetical protein